MRIERTNWFTNTPTGKKFLKHFAARRFRRAAKQDPENAPIKPAYITPPD